MSILLVLALVYWLWFGLAGRSLLQDDGLSVLAAQGVLEHGYPLLPSGFIYHRGYVPSYLIAGASLVFGLNDFAVILPSLMMSLGLLVIVYLLARDVMGRPWVGVAAAGLLLTLSIQASFATSPRMYMALQFFTLLASYNAWRGYVKGEVKYQWLTFLALLGALLSHEQAGALLIVIPLSVLIVRWLKGSDSPRFNPLLASAGLILLYALYLVPFIYQLPGAVPPITVHGGLEPGHTD
jgi:4-amino-4-deoxy-L-arabinose transferase-like glycosyltransferase